jgi:hypothetical protein
MEMEMVDRWRGDGVEGEDEERAPDAYLAYIWWKEGAYLWTFEAIYPFISR